ncbi:MAG TPA: metallophosphoesterase [Flavisolibacter sp.]|nr:metallophosphoesterase [Flavisolibacter sp.]
MKTKALLNLAFTCFVFFCLPGLSSAQTTLIPYSTSWKYLDNNTRPAGWETTGFNDAAWASGNAELGYGDADEATTVSYGPDAANKYVTTYFRKSITIADINAYSNFTLNVERDDGFVVYVNGVEVARDNMPAGTPAHGTFASTNVEDAIVSATVPASAFVTGTNVIAVEVHQSNVSSSDLSFRLELIGNAAATSLIAYGGSWKYLVTPSAPAATWKDASFDDASWSSGNAELGYGDGGEATVLGYGSDVNNKYPTTYFRRTFNLASLSGIGYFTINAIRDDGIVIYVNGVEVARDNMPTGTISYGSFASAAIGGTSETTAVSFVVSPSYFVAGANTIAVEVHQSDASSSDLSFNLQLQSNPPSPASITRGPYLQMGNETGITIRWRTNVPSDSKVDLGTAAGVYTISATDNAMSTEHEVRVNGLSSDTKYFYQVGSTTQVLEGSASNFFRTAPPANTTRRTRFAVFGDCGRNDLSYRSLSISHYLSYLAANGADAADAWLLLGDNAYNDGTDAQYTSNFFTPFQANLLKNHKLYPAPGNHDYYSSTQASRTGAYYQSFTMPANGECGGVASGTEAYYSYDIGNVHFLSLDSYGTEAGATRLYDTTGPQVTWIKADLAANTKKWVVAYWHHPPYTMGSHNSDSEGDLASIRNNFIRILERYGVDMILCGHSHDYERSYLLNGHYGNEASFSTAAHAKSSSTGRYDGSSNSCAYTTTSTEMNHGTIYVVAGSSGADGGVQSGYPHNAFPFSIDDGGMFYFEVEDNRLDAKFIRRDGTIADRFSIMQDVNRTNNINIITGSSVTLTASWIGDYSWSNGATTRSVTVSPGAGLTTYSVTDNSGSACITDVFNVTASGVLPVSLLNYDVKLRGDKVHISWSTGSEVNNKDFTIERSADARNFSPIGVVPGNGTTSSVITYSFIDGQPLYKDNYYRLKQRDRDDRFSYLPVKKIYYNYYAFNIGKVNASNGQLLAELEIGRDDVLQVQVFDLIGRKLVERRMTVVAGKSTLAMPLGSGNYIMQLTNGQGRTISKRIVNN